MGTFEREGKPVWVRILTPSRHCAHPPGLPPALCTRPRICRQVQGPEDASPPAETEKGTDSTPPGKRLQGPLTFPSHTPLGRGLLSSSGFNPGAKRGHPTSPHPHGTEGSAPRSRNRTLRFQPQLWGTRGNQRGLALASVFPPVKWAPTPACPPRPAHPSHDWEDPVRSSAGSGFLKREVLREGTVLSSRGFYAQPLENSFLSQL